MRVFLTSRLAGGWQDRAQRKASGKRGRAEIKMMSVHRHRHWHWHKRRPMGERETRKGGDRTGC